MGPQAGRHERSVASLPEFAYRGDRLGLAHAGIAAAFDLDGGKSRP